MSFLFGCSLRYFLLISTCHSITGTKVLTSRLGGSNKEVTFLLCLFVSLFDPLFLEKIRKARYLGIKGLKDFEICVLGD